MQSAEGNWFRILNGHCFADLWTTFGRSCGADEWRAHPE